MYLSQHFLTVTPLLQPAVSPPRKRHLYGHFQTRGDEAHSARWKPGGPSLERAWNSGLLSLVRNSTRHEQTPDRRWYVYPLTGSRRKLQLLSYPSGRLLSWPSLLTGQPSLLQAGESRIEQTAGLEQDDCTADKFGCRLLGSSQVLHVQESS